MKSDFYRNRDVKSEFRFIWKIQKKVADDEDGESVCAGEEYQLKI